MPHSDPTDKTNPADPDRWLEHYGDILFRFALRRVRVAELAEELVQEALLAGLRSADSFEGRSTEQTWLIGILRRKIVDHFRSRASRTVMTSDTLAELAEPGPIGTFDGAGHWSQSLVQWSGSATQLCENQEFWSIFEDCLARLSRTQAAAFTLREMESMSSEEICKILALTPSNLWTQLHRARLILRQCMNANWFQKNA